jgi:hypothetical protein
MKYIKYTIPILILAALLLIGIIARKPANSAPARNTAESTDHLYVSWDTMEFDKCVAAWLIVRFIDKDAQFQFVPQNTEITQGVAFDIPGAEWSRKHRKGTSQCIWESIGKTDPAVENIVSIAGRVELNFWQLDRWPQAQRCFYEVKKITDQAGSLLECLEKTRPYFDELYEKFKKGQSSRDSADG